MNKKTLIEKIKELKEKQVEEESTKVPEVIKEEKITPEYRPSYPKVEDIVTERISIRGTISKEEEKIEEEEQIIPEAYGTKRLFLIAKDPHWLYTYWDLTNEQINEYINASKYKNLMLRVYILKDKDNFDSKTFIQEIPISIESKDLYLRAPKDDTYYLVELGYYDLKDKFQIISTSPVTKTPRTKTTIEKRIEFVSIPIDKSFDELKELLENYGLEPEKVAKSLAELKKRRPELLKELDKVWEEEEFISDKQIESIQQEFTLEIEPQDFYSDMWKNKKED